MIMGPLQRVKLVQFMNKIDNYAWRVTVTFLQNESQSQWNKETVLFVSNFLTNFLPLVIETQIVEVRLLFLLLIHTFTRFIRFIH
jgi:hypothetical protein